MATKILQIIPATAGGWHASFDPPNSRAVTAPIVAYALIETGVGDRTIEPLIAHEGQVRLARELAHYKGVWLNWEPELQKTESVRPDKQKPGPREHLKRNDERNDH